MRKRIFVIGAVAGVLGALSLSSIAVAGSPQSQSLTTTLSPSKQSKQTFGGARLHAIISTTYDNFIGSHSPRQTTFTIDPTHAPDSVSTQGTSETRSGTGPNWAEW